MDIFEQLGKRIAYLRKERKMSQLSLALEADINKNYLCDLENGKRNPTLLILNKIAVALGINLSILFQGIEDFTLEEFVKTIENAK